MSAHTMNTSGEAWGPDARSFNPDRWLKPDSKSLEQYQAAFSKGARMCNWTKVRPLAPSAPRLLSSTSTDR